MKGKNNNIDDLFRGKVYDYSTPPPESVWKDIEQSLSKSKRRKVVFLYFKIAAGFIFLAGMTALYTNLTNTRITEIANPVVAEKFVISKDIQQTKQNQTMPQEERKVIAAKIKTHKLIQRVSQSNADTNNLQTPTPTGDKGITNVEESSADIAKINSEQSLDRMQGITPSIDQLSYSKEIKRKDSQTTPIVNQNPNDALFDDLMAYDETEKTRNMIWSVGGQVGPQYTYRRLSNESQIATNSTNYNNYDSPMLAYAGGLQIEVEPAKRLSIQSGVYYSKVGQNISSRYIDASKNDYFENNSSRNDTRPVEIVNSIGTLTFSDNPDIDQTNIVEGQNDYAFAPINSSQDKADFTGQQYFEFIEIPLILKYKIIDQKFDFKIIGGMNTDILVNNYGKVTNNSDITLEGSTQDLNVFNYSGTVGFGFEYPLSKKILFSMEPFFKYYLTPINKSAANDAHPYMIGIMTGVNYSF